MPPSTAATIFVCTCCRLITASEDGSQESYHEPGHELLKRLEDLTSNDPLVAVSPVECLAVCTRACTVAFVGKEKWTYIIGDIDTGEHAQDIAAAARAFALSNKGIVPWRDRPTIFRKGVVARVPPTPQHNAHPADDLTVNIKNLKETKSP